MTSFKSKINKHKIAFFIIYIYVNALVLVILKETINNFYIGLVYYLFAILLFVFIIIVVRKEQGED